MAVLRNKKGFTRKRDWVQWMKVTINGIKYEIVVTDSSYGVNLNSPGYATNINPFTAKGFYGQCTWYCWGRAYEKGVSLSWGNGSFGNAIDWYRNAAGNYVCDQTPSANSIMVSPDGGYYDSNGNYHQTGHVMFVEKVEGGYAYITEGNYNGQNYHEDWIQLSTGRRNWGSGAAFSITGYIHLPDGGNYLNLGDDFYANIAATGFDNWIFLENHGGNVQLWDKANDYSDTRLQWHFLRQQDDSYRIISMYDGRYLNADAMGSAGYNVSVYSYLDWEAQNWFIIRNGNWYSFVPKYDTQICLDVTNAAVAGGTNIQLWNRSDGSEAQLFDIYKYDLEKYPLALNLGDDFYANIAATGFDNWIFLENHAGNVQLWDKQNDYTDTRLQWHFIRQQDGSYRIINMYDGRYLNADAMGSAGYNVSVYSYLDWEAQSWFIIRNGNWYSFVPKYDMQICLDVTNAAVAGGTNIQLWNRSDGSEAQLFDIYKFDYTPVNISGAEISFIDNYVYTGKPIEPSPDVKIGDLPLIYDKHYTVSYSNNTNVGRATVIITGTGAYTGTITKAFSITKATPGLYFASASLSKKPGDADFTNTLTKTTDGAVTFKSSNTSVATVNSTSGKVTIKGAGTVTITATAAEGTNYKSGSASYILTVTTSKTDISGCTITLSPTSYTYNGKTKKPTVTITSGSSTLVVDTDYTVSYSNNTNAGTATVTITGKGNYTGAISKTFTINKAAAKLTFANASVSKTTKDAAFTNTLTKTTDGTVTFKSSNTNVATVNSTSGKVTIKGAGKATITATASAGTNYKTGSVSYTLTVTAPAPAGFSDVQDPSHPYYKAIYWAADAGITKGYPDGTFGIDRACTRSEAVMFLWRMAGKPAPVESLSSPFSDVPKTHAHYKAILWASQRGITKGYSDGTFGVNKTCTRGHIMTFIWRFKGQPTPKTAAKSPFSDVPKTHAYYKAILWGAQNGVTNGYSDGTFGINKDCTRGQIVTFLYRIK